MIIKNPYAPIEAINFNEINKRDVQLFVKREDLSHPYISGNKWRKLKYNIIEAEKLNKSVLVTFGGPYSNHLLATAAAAAKYNFKSVGFVKGETVSNPLLNLCKVFGMEIYFVERETYKYNKKEYALKVLNAANNCFIIDEGGLGELGEKGVAELIDELTEPYSHLFCSVGTGSTFKGLYNGLYKNHLLTKLYGVFVIKGVITLPNYCKNLDADRYRLINNYHFGGYAKVNSNLLNFTQYFASNTGILLDYVYEAKMMYALFDLIKNDYFNKGDRILALHNGGLAGMLGYV